MKKEMKLACSFLIACLLALCSTSNLQAQREIKTINSGWFFAKGMHPDSSRYTPVAIPHTWNTDAYTDKQYYRGTAWYRKTLTLPSQWKGKRIFLRFEAVSQDAEVFVNGHSAGSHKGGYTGFTLDITSFCLFDSPNLIHVRADNNRQDTPPLSGDFTFFGGIYRDVWLMAVPAQHFDLANHGSDGIFISTPYVSDQEGTLLIKGAVNNDAKQNTEIEIAHTCYAPDGKAIRTLQRKVKLKPGETYHFQESPAPIPQPALWSPEHPQLYRVESCLYDKKTRQLLDRVEHNIGFRWYHFDGKKGFSLNGKPYKLNGLCRHQDQKPVGVALSDEAHRRDILLMKEMGANFLRISHYPQDAALLELCDKLGMLAWEEIPVIDIVPESETYANTCELNLKEMIRQHYNHPSIILWGYMNEILLVTQRRYKTQEAQKPVLERTLALAQRLEKTVKEEDPYRKSTMAFHGSNSYNETGLGKITDVVGWNLYSGWYGGNLEGFEYFLAEQQKQYPDHPVIVSEYGAGSDKRLHSLQPKSFDFSIEYQQKYLEHYLPVISQTPSICGGTHWNFIDFSSALRDESMPRLNNKGLVYADRTPKDVFFYYKAMFRKDTPVLHIASRDWDHRSGIQEDAFIPVVQPVKIYTNQPEVELFLQGRSLGKKRSHNCTVIFDVPFQAGNQFVRAISGQLEDGMNIHFTPIPTHTAGWYPEGLELAINVGSNCFYTSPQSGLTWIPDRPYQQGSWGYLPDDKGTACNQPQMTQTEIRLTDDGPLFQTSRSQLNGYRFDVPAGTYELELLLADIFQATDFLPYQLGEQGKCVSLGNAFHILINNRLVEEACCPSLESGTFHAIKKRYLIHVTQGEKGIEVQLQTLNGKNFLNGIKLRKL